MLSVHNNVAHESYTAHVAPATFSDKDRWFIKRDTKDPNKIVYHRHRNLSETKQYDFRISYLQNYESESESEIRGEVSMWT